MSTTRRCLITLSYRAYRVLLTAYPPRFGRAYGDEIAQLVRDYCREAYRSRGLPGLLGAWGPGCRQEQTVRHQRCRALGNHHKKDGGA
jgi:hypothetical protein